MVTMIIIVILLKSLRDYLIKLVSFGVISCSSCRFCWLSFIAFRFLHVFGNLGLFILSGISLPLGYTSFLAVFLLLLLPHLYPDP